MWETGTDMKNEAVTVKTIGNNIEVLIIKDSWLDAEKFTFRYFDRHEFKLIRWTRMQKKTKRHKYQIVEYWDWYERNGGWRYRGIKLPPVPSNDIIQAVKDEFVSTLTFELSPA